MEAKSLAMQGSGPDTIAGQGEQPVHLGNVHQREKQPNSRLSKQAKYGPCEQEPTLRSALAHIQSFYVFLLYRILPRNAQKVRKKRTFILLASR